MSSWKEEPALFFIADLPSVRQISSVDNHHAAAQLPVRWTTKPSPFVGERSKLLQAVVLFKQALFVWYFFNASNSGTNPTKALLGVIDLTSVRIRGWPSAACAGERTHQLALVGSILQPCRLLGPERRKKSLINPAFSARRRGHEFDQRSTRAQLIYAYDDAPDWRISKAYRRYTGTVSTSNGAEIDVKTGSAGFTLKMNEDLSSMKVTRGAGPRVDVTTFTRMP